MEHSLYVISLVNHLRTVYSAVRLPPIPVE